MDTGYQDDILKMVSQQYKDRSDYMAVQAGMALYWWHKLINFDSSRVRVKVLNQVKMDGPNSEMTDKLLKIWKQTVSLT